MFNILKAVYRKELAKFSYMTDATRVGKINFLRCYIKAKKAGTKAHLRTAWRHTGNWLISRLKALSQPEIQQGRESTPDQLATEICWDKTPTTSRHINDLAMDRSATTRLLLRKVAKAFEPQLVNLVVKDQEVIQFKARIERLLPKRRKKVPSPNRKFIEVGTILPRGPQSTATVPPDAQEELVVKEEEDGGGRSRSIYTTHNRLPTRPRGHSPTQT